MEKQGRKRTLDTPKRMIERKEREKERERKKCRRRDIERKGEIRERERESERGERDREVKGIEIERVKGIDRESEILVKSIKPINKA